MRGVIRGLLIVVLAFAMSPSCQLPTETDYELARVELCGVILPGRISPGDNATVKFIWQGGGCLRSIGAVKVWRCGHHIAVVPLGKYHTWDSCPCDVFTEIDVVSLEIRSDGSYTIAVIGKPWTYYGSLVVPMTAPDSLFQFDITTVDRETMEPVVGIEVYAHLLPPADTILAAVTDSSGTAILTYPYGGTEVLEYGVAYRSPYRKQYLGSTEAIVGQPERITLGIWRPSGS